MGAYLMLQWGSGLPTIEGAGITPDDIPSIGALVKLATRQAALDDRPEPEDRADGTWLEPHDGDVGAERDAARHVGRGTEGDW